MDTGHDTMSLSEKKYQAVWERGADAMLFLDPDGVLDCNESGLRLFGLTERETMLGRPLADFAPPMQPHGKASADYLAAHLAAALDGGESHFECQLKRADGTLFVADVRLHRIDIGGGRTAHAVLRDVTNRWRVEQHLRTTKDAIEASLYQLAYFDTLTGLPNRAQLYEWTQIALAAAAAAERPMALCCVAIGDLKEINRCHCRDAGDIVIKTVAERLRAAVPQTAIVARISDNLFCILLDDCEADCARRTARDLVAASTAPVALDGQELCIGLAVGIAMLGTDGKDLWTLLQNAEAALYRAQSRGADNIGFHTTRPDRP